MSTSDTTHSKIFTPRVDGNRLLSRSDTRKICFRRYGLHFDSTRLAPVPKPSAVSMAWHRHEGTKRTGTTSIAGEIKVGNKQRNGVE